ncbi:MAG: hypothetical protein ACKVJZ_01565 [Planctomycetota bacterium]|jgi:hypothetical protein
MKFSLPLIFVLAASPLAAQNVQFSSKLDQPNNVIGWGVSSSIGTINVSPNTFRMGGTMDFMLDSANAPFTSGSFNGALVYTAPLTLSGEMPNPLPFLPPLAEFDIKNLELAIHAPTFSIDPNTGNFTAVITTTVTKGIFEMTGLLGNSTESLAGVTGIPTPVAGNVSQNGNMISLWSDMTLSVTYDDPATGVSVDVNFNGDVETFALSSEANSMHIDVPYGLSAGATNTIQFSNGTPNGTVYLAGSARGRGAFSIPSLGVDLGLRSPQHIATANADINGNGSFNVYLPAGYVGLSVLLQALEPGSTSNAAGTYIE